MKKVKNKELLNLKINKVSLKNLNNIGGEGLIQAATRWRQKVQKLVNAHNATLFWGYCTSVQV